MASTLTSSDDLEEILRCGEMEFFPKLRRYVESFIDIYHHDATQLKLRQKMSKMIEKLDCIKGANSVFDILIRLCDARKDLESAVDPHLMLNNLLRSGFYSILFDDELSFLEDSDLSIRKRAKKLIAFLCKMNSPTEANNSQQAFDDYITTWERQSRQRKGPDGKSLYTDKYIKHAIASMRDEFKATVENKKYLKSAIAEIASQFEPLRVKLQEARNSVATEEAKYAAFVAACGAIGFVSIPPVAALCSLAAAITVVGKVTVALGETCKKPPERILQLMITAGDHHATGNSAVVGDAGNAVHSGTGRNSGTGADCSNNRDKRMWKRGIPGWFEKTKKQLVDFVEGKISNNDLLDFLEREGLEEDIQHFRNCLFPYIDEVIEKCKKPFPYLPKEAFMLEIERASKFLYAVVLNRPQMLKEHIELTERVMCKSAEAELPHCSANLLPCISFGQLPLAGGGSKRIIQMAFILDSSLNSEEILVTCEQLKKLLGDVQNCKLAVEKELNVIRLDVAIEDNVATLISNTVSKFSDLSIRGVLVGQFGIGNFRHAMNPNWNRIYSLHGKETAEGFISTYFPGSLDRGGEPYYCPNGWRRYAIDVGMTGEQFEKSYGNWHVVYHGTRSHLAMAILLSGLRASGEGCYITNGEGAVYLSPSIEYCGHPRYARVWKIKDKYIQLVLQVRVDRKLIFEKMAGTLPGAYPKDFKMDQNFSNNELEWVIKRPPGRTINSNDGILIYGLMLRVTDEHPGHLTQNRWWRRRDIYDC